ncbi:DUF2399 domain-containing protein [Actinokineospora sp. 24-640]
MTPDPRRPEYEVLWRQARKAVQRGQVKLGYKAPTPAAAAAVTALIGRTLEAGVGTTIPVADLDGSVRSVFHRGLSDLLADVHGSPAEHRPDQPGVDAARREWTDDLLRDALASAGLSAAPWAAVWVDQVRRYAKIAPERLAEPAARAAAVLARLHLTSAHAPPTWLSRVGVAREAGDEHCLDPGRKAGALVLRAAALAHGVALPKSRRDETRLWERCGVTDGAGDAVLVHGFPGLTGPVHVPLRGLDRLLGQTTVDTVWVCSRPRLVEAAADAGLRAPLVCLSGRLSPTARVLLSRLAESGDLAVHADFDPAGLLVTGQVLALGATPWRMAADDYRAALDHARAQDIDLPALDGDPGPTPWDPTLPDAMRAGWAVPEEVVTDLLLNDL